MRLDTNIHESCICVSRICMSHVPPIPEQLYRQMQPCKCHTREWVISHRLATTHIWIEIHEYSRTKELDYARIPPSKRHTCEWITLRRLPWRNIDGWLSRIWTRHCHTCEWFIATRTSSVMLRIRRVISHIRRHLQHTATHTNTLQHIATHCNTLQHAATHCNTLQHTVTHPTKNIHRGYLSTNLCRRCGGSRGGWAYYWKPPNDTGKCRHGECSHVGNMTHLYVWQVWFM